MMIPHGHSMEVYLAAIFFVLDCFFLLEGQMLSPGAAAKTRAQVDITA